VLVANRKLRVSDDVDEQDMRDFQLDFVFTFGGHKARRKGSRAKGESPLGSRTSSTTRILHHYGTARKRFLDFRFFLHHYIGFKSSPLSVHILTQPHELIEASASRFASK
jgi:hypothetical protein